MFKRFGTLAMALGCLALTQASSGCTKTVTTTTTATCKDGKKNGTETGVDCGGSCAACTGGSGGGTTGCGTVTADGACSGSSIQVCDTATKELDSFDCKDFILTQGTGQPCTTDADCTKLRADLKCDTANKECVIIQQATDATCTTATGTASPYCATPEGGLCIVENGDSLIPLMCGNANGPIGGLGCDALMTACTQTAATCTPSTYTSCSTVGSTEGCGAGESCVEGTDTNGQKVKVCAFTGSCQGTLAVLDCTAWGQPYYMDCGNTQLFGTGATCGTAPKGLGCVNIAAGSYCDGQYFLCASGNCDTATNRCK